MIMTLKYIGTLLTSIALVVAAAAVSAQQTAPPREETKGGVPDRPAYPQKLERSADIDPLAQVTNDSDLRTGIRSVYGRNIPWFSGGGGEQNELSKAEAAVARKADELKRMLERAKGDSRRNEVRTKLAENLGQQFDLRQKRHGLELEALERQVAKLKELVRKRQESRDDIISRRVEEIQREIDGLGW
jgi:hypothetical protein